jgi:type II secretory pathway pseudopilin PulG
MIIKNKKTAFTLIETLIAIVFSIIVTTGVIKMVNISNDTITRSLDRENLNIVFNNIIQDLGGDGTNLSNYDGICDSDETDEWACSDTSENGIIKIEDDDDIPYKDDWGKFFTDNYISDKTLKIFKLNGVTPTGETTTKYNISLNLVQTGFKDFDPIDITRTGSFSYVTK